VALVKNCPLVFYNAVAGYGKMRHTRRRTLKKMRSIAEQSSHPDSKIMLQERRKDRRKKKEMVKVSVKSFIERAQVALFLWPAIITFRSRLDVSFSLSLAEEMQTF
jgi:hypothetical protein